MATTVINPAPVNNNESSNNGGEKFLYAAIFLIIFLVIFFVYIFPYVRNLGSGSVSPQINVPKDVNVKVQTK